MEDIADQLVLVTEQIDDLTAELRVVGGNIARREEIIGELIRLGRLYLKIRAENGLVPKLH